MKYTNFNDEAGQRRCEECLADLSYLPDQVNICPFCGADIEEEVI